MPRDQTIKATGLKWKKNSLNTNFIGAFQVIISNGCHSPIFLGKTQNADNLEEVKITPQVKKIRGSVIGNHISMIYFQDKDGTEIAKIVASERSFAPDQILEDDEEIIGVYGTKN